MLNLPEPKSRAAVVTLQHFRDIPEALLAKGKLESVGIPCVLADGNLVRMDWLLSNAIGGIRLQVHERDIETARAVLDEPIPPEFSEEQVGEEYTQPRCPRCYCWTSASRSSIAFGLSACGYCSLSRFLSEKIPGNAILAVSSGRKIRPS